MRRTSALAAVSVLAMNIVATVFTILATTNNTWSYQNYYFDPDASDLGINDTVPLCTATRSPFYRCGIPRVDENGTCVVPECAWYSPSGYNKTSCRSAAEVGVTWVQPTQANGLLGRRTECQEVHYAGNLQIAAATFISLGLVVTAVTLALSLLYIVYWRDRREQDAGSKDAHADHRSPSAAGNRELGSQMPNRGLIAHATTSLLVLLYVGAMLQVLAQFFGVLGLTVNATPAYDGAVAAQANSSLAHYTADNWEMGKGLTTYATIAWTFAIASAFIVTLTLPSRGRSTIL